MKTKYFTLFFLWASIAFSVSTQAAHILSVEAFIENVKKAQSEGFISKPETAHLLSILEADFDDGILYVEGVDPIAFYQFQASLYRLTESPEHLELFVRELPIKRFFPAYLRIVHAAGDSDKDYTPIGLLAMQSLLDEFNRMDYSSNTPFLINRLRVLAPLFRNYDGLPLENEFYDIVDNPSIDDSSRFNIVSTLISNFGGDAIGLASYFFETYAETPFTILVLAEYLSKHMSDFEFNNMVEVKLANAYKQVLVLEQLADEKRIALALDRALLSVESAESVIDR